MSVIAIKDSPSTVDFSFNSTFKENVNRECTTIECSNKTMAENLIHFHFTVVKREYITPPHVSVSH